MSQTNTTKAWVIHPGAGDLAKAGPAELLLEDLPLASPGPGEVLMEPLYGSWEGNMTHAIARRPVDICRARKEAAVVLGNSGVGRVLARGPNTTLKEGQICLFALPHEWDPAGYPTRVMGFDLPGVRGILAQRGVWKETDVVPVPEGTRHSLVQWAAFGVRYLTAWSSWRVAYGAWRLQMEEADQAVPHVWGWGGGTTLATLQLAKHFGASTSMISGNPLRLAQIEGLGVHPVDRRAFTDLSFEEERFGQDAAYAARYMAAEKTFLELVGAHTGALGVSIFIDYIGTPVTRATLRALARQGVIATAGWRAGMEIKVVRASECIRRHTHVHTHYCRRSEVPPAVRFAEDNGWMPHIGADEKVYAFDDVPRLAQEFAAGSISSYFPVFQVNPV